jgi:PAS domain-containing protein
MDPTPSPQTSLRRAVDFLPQGFAVFDADLHLLAANSRYGELLDLPARLVGAGTSLYDIALFL